MGMSSAKILGSTDTLGSVDSMDILGSVGSKDSLGRVGSKDTLDSVGSKDILGSTDGPKRRGGKRHMVSRLPTCFHIL